MMIATVQDFGRVLKQGAYAWPGGYPLFFITADGACLSFATAWEERANIVRAILDNDSRSGWRVTACDVNWENPDLYCEQGGRIESAYAESEASEPYEHAPVTYNRWRARVWGYLPRETETK